jgi:hypothetical protein
MRSTTWSASYRGPDSSVTRAGDRRGASAPSPCAFDPEGLGSGTDWSGRVAPRRGHRAGHPDAKQYARDHQGRICSEQSGALGRPCTRCGGVALLLQTLLVGYARPVDTRLAALATAADTAASLARWANTGRGLVAATERLRHADWPAGPLAEWAGLEGLPALANCRGAANGGFGALRVLGRGGGAKCQGQAHNRGMQESSRRDLHRSSSRSLGHQGLCSASPSQGKTEPDPKPGSGSKWRANILRPSSTRLPCNTSGSHRGTASRGPGATARLSTSRTAPDFAASNQARPQRLPGAHRPSARIPLP